MSNDIPSEIIHNFVNKMVFKCSKSEATYLLSNAKTSEIRHTQKGRCETDQGTMQFPFIEPYSISELIKKHKVPLKSKCLFMK